MGLLILYQAYRAPRGLMSGCSAAVQLEGMHQFCLAEPVPICKYSEYHASLALSQAFYKRGSPSTSEVVGFDTQPMRSVWESGNEFNINHASETNAFFIATEAKGLFTLWALIWGLL